MWSVERAGGNWGLYWSLLDLWDASNLVLVAVYGLFQFSHQGPVRP